MSAALGDQWVEITGPVVPKMVINFLTPEQGIGCRIGEHGRRIPGQWAKRLCHQTLNFQRVAPIGLVNDQGRLH